MVDGWGCISGRTFPFMGYLSDIRVENIRLLLGIDSSTGMDSLVYY